MRGVFFVVVVACLCSLKRSRSVRLVSPIHLVNISFTPFTLDHIIYVRFLGSQVMRCLICLVSPVLVKMYDFFPGLMYRQVRQPFLELQRNVPAGGLGVLSLLASSDSFVRLTYLFSPQSSAPCTLSIFISMFLYHVNQCRVLK